MADEYISREAAREKLCSMCRYEGTDNCGECEHPIDDISVADVAPVRHGRWEKNNDGIMIWWECSECHHDAWYDRDDLYNYCPNCGAKMDGGE